MIAGTAAGFPARPPRENTLALGLALASILLFVGIGSEVAPQIVRSLRGVSVAPNHALVTALILNIALILMGWKRHHDLTRELNQRRISEAAAVQLAETDPLTGLLNRRSLFPGAEALIHAAHGRKEAVAILMIDIDNFKQINDYHGHCIGDRVLVEAAQRIASVLPERAILARPGGDEFACIFAFDPQRIETVDRLASAIIAVVSQPVECQGARIDASVSIGVACSKPADRAPDDGPPNPQTLGNMADIAMYHAKKTGRNRYVWFDPHMDRELQFRRELEDGIRKGIAAGEFVPFYEQQIDVATGRIIGFEMLARWDSPKLGQIGPDVFIPVAEEIGAISALSEAVIAQALADARDWDPSLTLSVNISPLQLRDPWFAQKLLRLLVDANFPPQRLEIEITESCLHQNVGVVRALIASLKNQGIRVSLDDFGTGYSSLAQLRSLPFDRIKIDRSFVTNLPRSADSAAIVHAIALLGKGLGLPVTVEGIENEDILAMLRQYDDIAGQGYVYGMPQPASDTQDRLAGLQLLAGGQSKPDELPAILAMRQAAG